MLRLLILTVLGASTFESQETYGIIVCTNWILYHRMYHPDTYDIFPAALALPEAHSVDQSVYNSMLLIPDGFVCRFSALFRVIVLQNLQLRSIDSVCMNFSI